MRFEYDLDMGDYKNYLVYHFDNSKRFQNAYRNRLIIGIVFLIVFYWVIFRSYTDLITVMIEVVVLLLYIVCSKKLFTYISIERELRKVNSEQFSGHYIANLLEDYQFSTNLKFYTKNPSASLIGKKTTSTLQRILSSELDPSAKA